MTKRTKAYKSVQLIYIDELKSERKSIDNEIDFLVRDIEIMNHKIVLLNKSKELSFDRTKRAEEQIKAIENE